MTTTKNISDKPPPLAGDFTLPKTRDLPRNQKPWKDVNLPIDIMLLTVKECEFLSCHKLLKNSFKSYIQVLGYIYFGGIGIDEPLKVALIKCQEGANTPSGSTITVKNAVTILQPKAVFAVGYCSGLQRCTTRLGDVVVCSKLTQYASQNVQNSESTGPARVPVSRDMLQLIKDAAAGWNPPLLDPTSREIEVHCDAEYLSGPEHVCSKQRCDELTRLYPNAKAIEMEAEGVYVAAYDLKMEWVVVKGISGYANGTEGNREEWRTFASVMAASVVENMLSDSVVFQSWPHYKGPSYLGAPGPAVVWQASAGSPGMERSESNNTMDTGEPSDLGAPRPAVVLQASAGSPGMERSESNNTMDTGGNLQNMAAAITVESENQTISKREPPEVHVKVLELENLPSLSKPWKDIRNQYQPVDVLLLTVKDCEFLSCLSYLNEGFVKSNPPTLGTVYFGNIGDDEVVKVAVMKCDMGSSTPGGSLVVVPKAVRSLRPKAVFNVGFCASLNEEKAKLGDVVVCSKLITYAFITRTGNRIKERRVKVPLKRDLANLVKNIGDGWKPPLKNSTGQKVELRKDGVFLSDPEVVNNRKRRAELIKRYPEATAIEMEGEGLFVAAHDLNIEWIVIKGVSNLADGKKSETDHWRPFASLMAASLVAHTLKDAYVFESWPHFEDDSDTEGRRMPPSPSCTNPKRIKVAAGYKSTPYGLLGDRTMARTVLSSSSSGDDSDEEIDTLGSRWSSIPFLGPGPKKRKEAADDPDEESSTPKKRRSLFSPSDPGPEKSKAKAVNTSQRPRAAVSSTLKTETPNSGSQTKFLDWMKNLPYAESERCKIGDQGTTWSLKDIEAGACLTFTRDAVSTPLLFECRLYIPTVSFPPLNKDEKLVSSVIELTCDEQPGIHFSGEGKGEVVIAFSHSAPKLEGYEVVIREVVSTESSYECKDLETRNFWKMSDDFAKLRVPYAEANVTHCGVYAVIYRLKSYIYSTRVSGNEEITYSILEYPEVSVRIPAKNVQRRSKLELTFKVQEIHSKGFDCCEEFAGPVLHITCPQIPHLLKPATITLPVMLKGDKDELTRFSVTDVRVFECPSDDERAGWDEITKQLPNPAVLMNGVVTFQVKHFSRFTVWLTKIPQALGSLVPRINRLTRYPSVEAGFFACLCNFAEVSASEALALLRLFCYPVHLEGRVKREACASPGIYHYGSGDSLETLYHGDELRADARSGCTMNKILKLRFRSDDKFETSTMVELPRECTPHIELKFFLHLQEEQPQRELCGFPIATPHQSRTEDIHPDASNRMGRLLTTDHTRANVTRGESYAKDARPGPSTRGEGRSKRPGKRALTTSEDVSNRMRRSSTTDYTKAKVTRGMSADSSDSEGSSRKRSWLRSGPGRGPDPKRGKRPQGEFYAEDAQPGTSNQGGRRSTRPRDIAPTTSGGESYAEDAQPGPSNRGGQRSTRPRDTAPTTSRVMAGRPSEDELEELSQELGEKWEELAGRLGYNQAARSNFYANDRCSNRLARSAYSMLLAWKQREGSKATYEVLYNALCHKLVQCNLLAQKFCCE